MRPEITKNIRILGRDEDSVAFLEVVFNEVISRAKERHSVEIVELEKERVGIRADALVEIIKELEGNEELRKMFGKPVSAALVVIADNNDLRIEEAGAVKLSDGDRKRFVEILNEIIKRTCI